MTQIRFNRVFSLVAVLALTASCAALNANSDNKDEVAIANAPPAIVAQSFDAEKQHQKDEEDAYFNSLRALNLPSEFTQSTADPTALVEVYAGNFVSILKDPLVNHPIRVYIDTYNIDQPTQLLATDTSGFLRLQVKVGAKIWMTCVAGNKYHETSTAISVVPQEGLNGLFGRIVLQVPTDLIFDLFKILIGRPMPSGTCPIVVTITQYNVTYNTAPQGWDGVAATVDPSSYAVGDARPYYFGMFPFINKTNPLPNNRTTTTEDGGVVFPAIPVMQTKDTIIGAKYKDFPFSTTTIRCLKSGQFINAAPNQGPKALKKLHD